jgi:hypothetical protein
MSGHYDSFSFQILKNGLFNKELADMNVHSTDNIIKQKDISLWVDGSC